MTDRCSQHSGWALLLAVAAHSAPAAAGSGDFDFSRMELFDPTVVGAVVGGVSGAYLVADILVAAYDPQAVLGVIGMGIGTLDIALGLTGDEAARALAIVGVANVVVGLISVIRAMISGDGGKQQRLPGSTKPATFGGQSR